MSNQPQGKIFLYNYDAILALGDEPICISLSPKTIALCLSSIEYGRWVKRWQSLTGTAIVKDTVESITDKALSELLSDGGDCMCCPETNEVLRQMMSIQNTAYSDQLRGDYDGTPQSLGENIPANWDGDATTNYSDDDLQIALCQAITEFFSAALQDTATRLGIGAQAGLVLTTMFWLLNPIAGLISALIVGLVVDDVSDALDNETAIRKTICRALGGLSGREITHQSFIDAVANSGCAVDDDEETLQLIWETYASNEDNYLALLRHYARVLENPTTEAGECSCCGVTSGMRLDFKWFRASNLSDGYTRVREQSMYSEVQGACSIVYHIETYQSVYMVNDNEYGFRFYNPDGCCVRMRFLNRTDFKTGSGNFSPYHPPMAQREGVIVECPPCDGFDPNNPTEWFFASEVRFRWAENGTTHPAWLDDIQIEVDPSYAC